MSVTYTKTHQFNAVEQFQCVGNDCPDHCCGQWRVSVNDLTVENYKKNAPDLLDFIGKDEKGNIVSKDAETGNCSQLGKDGLCGIHKQYGEGFLPDTCMYYPRIVRSIGDELVVSANNSCPELMRKMFTVEQPQRFIEKDLDQLPEKITDFKYEKERKEDLLHTIQCFIGHALDDNRSIEKFIYLWLQVAEVLDRSPSEEWGSLVDTLFDQALPLNEAYKEGHVELEGAVFELFATLRQTGSEHWFYLVGLCQSLDLEAYSAHRKLYASSTLIRRTIGGYVRRYIVSDCMRTIFPYAGSQGSNVYDKALVMSIHALIYRSFLIMHIHDQAAPSLKEAVYIAQTMARGLNHLSKDLVKLYDESRIFTLTEVSSLL